MGLIQCAADCKYQADGYCELEAVARVTDVTNRAQCPHYVRRSADQVERLAHRPHADQRDGLGDVFRDLF